MRKKNIAAAMMVLLAALLGGCGGKSEVEKPDYAAETAASVKEDQEEVLQSASELADGIYTAEFTTDSSMFRVNETCDGKGILTVENGEMIIHISLGSKHIVNLYPGLAEDAEEEGAELLMPTEDTVTYSDGISEEVYGFDVPVPYLEEEFDLALIGTKGKWYDHKVSVSDPVPLEEGAQVDSMDANSMDANSMNANSMNADGISLEDGTYSIEISFEGGSGKAQILSPVTVVVTDGQAVATLQWSSPNYDYMIVDGEKYLPVNTQGDSVFEIPVLLFDEPVTVIGDTVAMSNPHEVEYTLTFHSDTMKK